MLENEIKI